MIRFYLLLFTLFCFPSFADESTLPPAKDFFMDAQQVWKNKTPILIMFSIPDCAFCKKVKEEVLSPMSQMKEYENKILIRHVDANSFDDVNNFFNEEVSHNEFSFSYAVNFFPTVILVDQYGASLDKVIGVVNEDFYWTDLDEVIDNSINKLKKQMDAKL